MQFCLNSIPKYIDAQTSCRSFLFLHFIPDFIRDSMMAAIVYACAHARLSLSVRARVCARASADVCARARVCVEVSVVIGEVIFDCQSNVELNLRGTKFYPINFVIFLQLRIYFFFYFLFVYYSLNPSFLSSSHFFFLSFYDFIKSFFLSNSEMFLLSVRF